jgi:hypothetical protein
LGVERFGFMTLLGSKSTIALCLLYLSVADAFSQALPPADTDAVRVNVTINNDGSRTIYEFDPAHHEATGTTTEQNGKIRGKIRYKLDDAGRFASGVVFGPDEKFRFKSTYKYNSAGRLEQETQLRNDDSVIAKIVYIYDPGGKQTGYSIFDAAGKLIGRLSSPTPTPSAPAKPRKSGR